MFSFWSVSFWFIDFCVFWNVTVMFQYCVKDMYHSYLRRHWDVVMGRRVNFPPRTSCMFQLRYSSDVIKAYCKTYIQRCYIWRLVAGSKKLVRQTRTKEPWQYMKKKICKRIKKVKKTVSQWSRNQELQGKEKYFTEIHRMICVSTK